ncbi:MAG: cytochrome c-550 [Cyanobacteria bacterium P01_E01_bin.48]
MFDPLALLKKLTLWLAVILLVAVSGYGSVPALADSSSTDEELDIKARTVMLTAMEPKTYAVDELSKGRKLFNAACGQCHIAGTSYTNPDVTLSLDDLTNATPPRNTVVAIVDYMHNPLTYDGEDSLLEYHPNVELKSIYPKMRNLDDEKLELIAAHVLQQSNVIPGWGGTKSEAHDTSWNRLGA